MGYTCSYCHYPVMVHWIHGVPEISEEKGNGKIRNINKCPRCGYPLITHNNLEFTPDDEYRREDERTAAI